MSEYGLKRDIWTRNHGGQLRGAKRGVAVEYCGEQFDNDGSMVSAILKNMKRVMASEYSRELSPKVSRAQLQQARLGFSQRGTRALRRPANVAG